MPEPDAEERRIDRLLQEMNIHLPDIPQDESETSEYQMFEDREFQDFLRGLKARQSR